jgi:hypothetical protein
MHNLSLVLQMFFFHRKEVSRLKKGKQLIFFPWKRSKMEKTGSRGGNIKAYYKIYIGKVRNHTHNLSLRDGFHYQVVVVFMSLLHK